MQNPQQVLSPDELLTQATCAVLIDNEVVGTAWLVSREGDLLTAGHLFEDYPVDVEVTVQFAGDILRQVQIMDSRYQLETGTDFAHLKLVTVTPPLTRYPLPIALARSVSGSCRLVGYGQTLGSRSSGIGEIIGFQDVNNHEANRLFRIRSAELGVEGYSGGAVFSDELQAVVAIQSQTTRTDIGAGRDTVLAMPLYRVVNYVGELNSLAGVVTRQPTSRPSRFTESSMLSKPLPTAKEFRKELRKLTDDQLAELCQDYETFEDLYEDLVESMITNSARIRKVLDFCKRRDKYLELHNALKDILESEYTFSN